MTAPLEQAQLALDDARRRGAAVSVLSGAAGVLIAIAAPPDSHVEWLTVVGAAKLAGTTEGVIRSAISSGTLPAYGGQRDRVVSRADLDAWVRSRPARVGRERPVDDDDREIERRVLALRGAK